METRANYFAIGLFTILGFLGILGFFAWFSKVELDKSFVYYDVYFTNVSGLNRAAPVKFAGLTVGQVVELKLTDDRDGRIRVVLEVDPKSPIRVDSEATVESQGVTGVSYVGISAGTPEQPLLTRTSGKGNPVIPSGRSALQTLTEDAPQVLELALDTMEQINAVFSDENRRKFDDILTNLGSASDDLDKTLSSFSEVAQNVGTSVNDIAGFTDQLEGMANSATSTLDLAENAFATIEDLAGQARHTLDAGTEMFSAADVAITNAGVFIENELTTMINDTTATSATLRTSAEELTDEVGAFLATWGETGDAATARLTQLDGVLSRANAMVQNMTRTLKTIDAAGASFDTLVNSDGVLLVAEARAAFASANDALVPLAETAEEDLPLIMSDLRSAANTIRTTVQTVGQDLSGASGRVEALSGDAQVTLAEVSNTFAQARTTLTNIDSALDTADSALRSADSAFTGADKVINEDIDGIIADLRLTTQKLNNALDQAAADLPQMTGDMRQAARDISAMVTSARGPVSQFIDGGLPQYTQLAAEARQLVETLKAVAVRVQRNPAQFITGGNTPEYRRR